MKALWDDDQVVELCGAIHGTQQHQQSGGRYLQRSRDYILKDLASSPSWNRSGVSGKEKGCHFDEYVVYLLDGINSRFILKRDAGSFYNVGSKFVATGKFLSDVYAAMIHPNTKGLAARIYSKLVRYEWDPYRCKQGS
jgi:hypothetical protein